MNADLKRTFSKRDTTNGCENLYKTIEILNDTLPSYKIDELVERYDEALLKKLPVTLKKHDSVMKKKYHLDQIKMSLSITTHRYQINR